MPTDLELEERRLQILEERYIEEIEERTRKKKEQKLEDEYIQKQLSELIDKGGFLQSVFSVNSVIMTALGIAAITVGVAGVFLSFISLTIMAGCALIETIESLAFSQETRDRKAVRLVNLVASTALFIAAVTMIYLNPASLPIAILLSTSAFVCMAGKNAYYLYAAYQDLDIATVALAKTEEELKKEPENEKLINKKTELMLQVNKYKAAVQEEKRNLFVSVVGLIGITVLAIGAFALAGMIVANPITLGIAGLVFLGAAALGGFGVPNVLKKYLDGKKPTIVSTPPVEKKPVPAPEQTVKHANAPSSGEQLSPEPLCQQAVEQPHLGVGAQTTTVTNTPSNASCAGNNQPHVHHEGTTDVLRKFAQKEDPKKYAAKITSSASQPSLNQIKTGSSTQSELPVNATVTDGHDESDSESESKTPLIRSKL